MQRRLVVCAVAVAVLVALAAVVAGQKTHAQSTAAAATGPVIVTAQAYPQLTQFSGTTTLPRGPLTVSAASAHGDAIAVGAGVALLSRADLPQRVVEPELASATSSTKAASLPLDHFAGSGQAGFAGDGGAATSAEIDLNQTLLARRSGIAVAADGTVYIADTKNATIRAVSGASSSEPGIIRSVAGRWAATQNVQLAEPMGIGVDRAGNVYIADHSAGTVSMLTKATGELSVLAHVASPASLAVTADGSKVFVASPDNGGVFAIATLTHAVTIVPGFTPLAASAENSASGPCAALETAAAATNMTAARTAAASAAAVTSKAICPAGVAVDGAGNLFVADANNGNILRVDAATLKTTETATGMIEPGDITFDTQGDLFVSEQGRSRVIAMGAVGDPAGSLELTAPAPPAGCPQGAAFTYCDEPTAGTSASYTFTLTNTSGSTVNNIVITPAYVQAGTNPPPAPTNFTTTSTSCTGSLSAGASCTIAVAFTPLTTGPIVGTLQVADGIAADAQSVNLAGTGDDFSLAIVAGLSPEVTVSQGNTATWSAQLNAVGAFGAQGETVQLSCPSNLPEFTACEFKACPVIPTVGGATSFSIIINTSTKTVETPPIANPCNSPEASSRIRAGSRSGVLLITTRPGRNGPSRFPALLLSAVSLALLALSYFATRKNARPGLRRALAGAVLAVMACGIVAACGGGGDRNSTATPTGSTNMNVTANAYDSSGNSLRASRGLQITMDVIPQQITLP